MLATLRSTVPMVSARAPARRLGWAVVDFSAAGVMLADPALGGDGVVVGELVHEAADRAGGRGG